jgi:hypothetical protein
MLSKLQQTEAGSQSSVDCSHECRVRDGAELCILEQLLLLLFDGSNGAVGTQYVPQRVGQARRGYPGWCSWSVCVSFQDAQLSVPENTHLIIVPLAVEESFIC